MTKDAGEEKVKLEDNYGELKAREFIKIYL